MSCELMAGLPQSKPHPSFHYIFPLSLGKSSDSAIFQIPHSLKRYKYISTTIRVIAPLFYLGIFLPVHCFLPVLCVQKKQCVLCECLDNVLTIYATMAHCIFPLMDVLPYFIEVVHVYANLYHRF